MRPSNLWLQKIWLAKQKSSRSLWSSTPSIRRLRQRRRPSKKRKARSTKGKRRRQAHLHLSSRRIQLKATGPTALPRLGTWSTTRTIRNPRTNSRVQLLLRQLIINMWDRILQSCSASGGPEEGNRNLKKALWLRRLMIFTYFRSRCWLFFVMWTTVIPTFLYVVFTWLDAVLLRTFVLYRALNARMGPAIEFG